MGETGQNGSRPPVVIVTGPTASGKTSTGIRLARRFGGEILNADSMQVYRYLDIGTAKPTLAERAEVPHHLIDIVAPDVQYNAGRYSRDAARAANEVQRRGRLVFLVGGTGLYIRVFLEGLMAGGGADPDRRRALEEEHRAAVEAGEPHRLHRRLASLDPESGERIHPNDVVRLIRALELIEGTGRTVSELRRSHRAPDSRYRTLHLVIDPGPEKLKACIDARCVRMVEGGATAGSAEPAGAGIRPGALVHARHRLPAHAAGDRWCRDTGQRARGDAEGHATLRPAPAHLAALAPRRGVDAPGRRRGAAESGRDLSRGSLTPGRRLDRCANESGTP